MTVAKITVLAGASIVTAGGSAAVATRNKWWPNDQEKSTTVGKQSSELSEKGSVSIRSGSDSDSEAEEEKQQKPELNQTLTRSD